MSDPNVSLGDLELGEGDGEAVFVLFLSEASDDPVTVRYQAADLTALAGSDFAAVTGLATFPAGTTTVTVSVPVVDDAVPEPVELLALSLSDPLGARLGRSIGVATLIDNDATAGVPRVAWAPAWADETTGVARVPVTLDRPSAAEVHVQYRAFDAPAWGMPWDDVVVRAEGTLTFAPGDVTQVIEVPIDDDLAGPVRTVILSIRGVDGALLPVNLGRSLWPVVVGASDQPPQAEPLIAVADAVASESDGFVDFVVRLNAPSLQPVGATWRLTDGSGLAGVDYASPGPQTLVFAPGQTLQTVRVALVDDAAPETAEHFGLVLESPWNASLGESSALATILDDDRPAATPLLTVSDVVVDEQAGLALLTFTLDRPSPALAAAEVGGPYGRWSLGPTATRDVDYGPLFSTTVVFAPGETAKTFAIPLLDDALTEGTEWFDATFYGIGRVRVIDNTARVYIVDGDGSLGTQPIVSISSTVTGESDPFVDLQFTLSHASSDVVTATWATSDGTALAGSDFVATSGALRFEPGEIHKSIRVGLIDDTGREPTEVFQVSLGALAGGGQRGAGTAVVAIRDNDAARGSPTIELHDTFVDEQDGFARVLVTLDRPASAIVSAYIGTYGGTALANQDFLARGRSSGYYAEQLSFAPGEVAKEVLIPIVDDDTTEPAEHFDLRLFWVSGADLPDAQARVYIAPSDGPPQAAPSIRLVDAVAGEGDGYVDLVATLDGPSVSTVSVEWHLVDSPATPQAVGAAGAGTLTFVPGQTLATVRVPVVDDGTIGSPRTFHVALDAPTGGVVASNLAAVTVVDDDAPAGLPLATVDDVFVDEKAGWAFVSVTLDRPASGNVSMHYATRNGSAKIGADYGGVVTQTLLFTAGEVAKTIPVALMDDGDAEGVETFDVLFTQVSNATMPDTRARVFIGASDQPTRDSTVVDVLPITASEADGHADALVILRAPSAEPVTVRWSLTDGTAVTGSDFSALGGAITFAPGETLKALRLPLLDDVATEPREQFRIEIVPSEGAVAGAGVVNANVHDDDGATGRPVIVAHDVVVDETGGLALVDVTLDRPSVDTVTVWYGTTGGSATTTLDFTVQTGQTLVFSPGQTAKTIAIPIVDDALPERAEEFSLALWGPDGATLATERARVIIGASDQVTSGTPSVAAADAVAVESDGWVDVVLVLRTPSDQAVRVDWATADGTAASPSDFAGQTGSVVFAPGETLKHLQVSLVDDSAPEAVEQFELRLTSPTVGVTVQPTVQATIVDDDDGGVAGWTGVGTDQDDMLTGAAGDDTLTGGAGHDVLRGGAGSDVLEGDDGDDVLDGGAGADVLTGGTGNDRILGDIYDTMAGGPGNDIYIVEWQQLPYYFRETDVDMVERPGEGIDTVRAPSWVLGPNFEILTLTGWEGYAIGNDLSNLLIGSAGRNLLRGGGGDDVLKGRAGNDALEGDDGDDVLEGGAGADVLTGGAGADVFRFASPVISSDISWEVDLIVDFATGVDRIELVAEYFPGIGAPGPVPASAFHVGSAAADPDDRLVYDPAYHWMSYDPDGTGGEPATVFLSLAPGTAVDASDLWIGGG